MPVPTTNTWTDDVLADQATLNAYIRDPEAWLLGLPTFSGRNTVATAMAQNVALNVPINTEDRNVGFTHSANSPNVTAQNAGWYRYIITAGFTSGTSFGNAGNRGLWLLKNGTTAIEGGAYLGTVPLASDPIQLGGRTGYVYLNGSTDFVNLVAIHSAATAAITTEASAVQSESSLTLLWQGRDA